MNSDPAFAQNSAFAQNPAFAHEPASAQKPDSDAVALPTSKLPTPLLLSDSQPSDPQPASNGVIRSLEKLGLWRGADISIRNDRRSGPGSGQTGSGQTGSGQTGSGQTGVATPEAEATLSGTHPTSSQSLHSTGCAALDQLLPDRGWPAASLVELLCDLRGIGELRLLMPALARLSRQQARWVAWIAPPHIPYAPALAAYGVDISRVLLIHPRTDRDRLWALEQAMKSGTCSAVLGWPGAHLRHQDIRRLQLAAVQGNTLGLLFREEQAALEASPAPFRLVLRAATQSANLSATSVTSTASTASATTTSTAATNNAATNNAATNNAATNNAATNNAATNNAATPQLLVKLLKRRGGWSTDFVPIDLPMPSATAQVSGQESVDSLQGLQLRLASWRAAQRSSLRAAPDKAALEKAALEKAGQDKAVADTERLHRDDVLAAKTMRTATGSQAASAAKTNKSEPEHGPRGFNSMSTRLVIGQRRPPASQPAASQPASGHATGHHNSRGFSGAPRSGIKARPETLF